MSPKTVDATVNPKTTHYEFLGPPGALFIILAVPTTTYALYFACSEQTGGCPPRLDTFVPNIIDSVGDVNWWKGLWDTQATAIYFAWYAFCVVAWGILPGDWVDGVTLRTGGTIKYKINGKFSLSLHFSSSSEDISSILHVLVRSWFDVRQHIYIRPRIVHVLVREMGRIRDCRNPHVDPPGFGLLRCFFPFFGHSCSWRQLGESHLRCKCHDPR